MNLKILNLPFFRVGLFLLPCFAWMAPLVLGQSSTTVNLSTQGRNPDFSSMPVTRPVSVGTSLPSTCVVGQLFFNSSATAGNNLSSCTSANVWSPIGANLTLPLSVANGGTGTATPGLVAGSNITISGSWPNQTINGTGSAVTIGSSLPSSCTVGQLFFNSSASAGSNLYGCTTANTWTVIGGATLTSPLPVANGGTGTATPSLVAGTNVTVTGSWPNQTISATGTGGGTSGNATSIQGATVSSTAPTNNQTLIYYGSTSSYVPTSIYTLQNGLGTAAVGSTNLQVNVSMGVRAVTSSTDTVVSTDCGGLVTYNNASAISVALPQPALGGNFLAGCPITIRNYGAGTVTITPSASTIGGTTNQAVNQNKGCLLVSDGTNWQLGNCN
jgi:hypothetical protein